MRTLLPAALVFVLIGACKKDDPGPPCDQVVDHMLEVTKQVMVGHDGMNGMGDRKAMIETCEQRHFTKEERTCLFAAKTLDGFAACRKPQLPAPARPQAPAPAPAPGSGGT